MMDESAKKESSTPTKETGKFRSVLPHEPLPKEEYGFLHVQGAFEPKHKKKTDSANEASTEAGAKAKTGEDEGNGTNYYWKDQSELRNALFKVLSKRYEDFKFPSPVHSIIVLDPAPPFTKVRLVYPSPRIAMEVMVAWRAQKLVPNHLFSDKESTGERHNVTFGSHTFQATLITTKVLPSASWSRSNPPKFRRLLAREGEENEVLIEQERANTRFVFITGLLENRTPPQGSFWCQTHSVVEAIRIVVDEFDTSGQGAEVFVSHKKMAHSCHVGMRTPEDAKRLVHQLQGKKCLWRSCDATGERMAEAIPSGTLFLDYVAITKRSLSRLKARTEGWKESAIRGEPSRPECTSTTDNIIVPGLELVPDFITPAEEDVLLAVLTGPQAPWAPNQTTISQTGFVKRMVQHYGYVFDYETANVLRDRSEQGADCPPLPTITESDESIPFQNLQVLSRQYEKDCRGWELFGCVIERTRQFQFVTTGGGHTTNTGTAKQTISFPDINQVTVNHYKPGEGIGSHVDTRTAFSDGLISISLGGGIVMEFRKVGNLKVKKLLYLPPRSLVLMSGPARYEWEHMIVTRRTDTVNGQVIPRTMRVSLTLRTAISLGDPPTPLPRISSSQFPPTWTSDGCTSTNRARTESDINNDETKEALVTPPTERDHVHAVYDAIATQWHHTRGKRGVLWPGATQFLQLLPPGSVVADVGCGDGKYFPAIWEAGSYVIGTDISLPLLQKCMSYAAMATEGRDSDATTIPDACRVDPGRAFLRDRPATAVADCMNVPLRSRSCDAAICIAVMHHLSTEQRRLRCIEELARIVRIGGTINIQAWAMEQEDDSRRRFAARDVFVPFNAQPKYLDKEKQGDSTVVMGGTSEIDEARVDDNSNPAHGSVGNKSVAQVYSEAYKNADFDEKKGLVVFRRYCHVYQKGELEGLVAQVPDVLLVESGYESGNHFVILEVIK